MLKSDLSKVKVGDWILVLQFGWEKVTVIYGRNVCLVETENSLFTNDGFYSEVHKHPTAFTDPPQELIALYGPKPVDLRKGDKVLCKGERRYFSHEEDGMYFCFPDGRTEWSNDKALISWEPGSVVNMGR